MAGKITLTNIEFCERQYLVQPDLDDKQLNEVLESLQMTFDHFKKAEEALWEQLKIK